MSGAIARRLVVALVLLLPAGLAAGETGEVIGSITFERHCSARRSGAPTLDMSGTWVPLGVGQHPSLGVFAAGAITRDGSPIYVVCTGDLFEACALTELGDRVALLGEIRAWSTAPGQPPTNAVVAIEFQSSATASKNQREQ